MINSTKEFFIEISIVFLIMGSLAVYMIYLSFFGLYNVIDYVTISEFIIHGAMFIICTILYFKLNHYRENAYKLIIMMFLSMMFLAPFIILLFSKAPEGNNKIIAIEDNIITNAPGLIKLYKETTDEIQIIIKKEKECKIQLK